jgi:transcriptional regulator with XRE-family HTH domain
MTMKVYENISSKFKLIRSMLHMSQDELCEAMGISRPNISKIEQNKRLISKTEALALYAVIHSKRNELHEMEQRMIITVFDIKDINDTAGLMERLANKPKQKV